MLWVLDAVLALGALILLVPSLVFAAECFIGALSAGPRRAAGPDTPRPKVAVLVPAHDEASGIAATLEDLKPQLGPEDRILVVADNCTDDTAEIARGCGVDVVERTDPENRGKGFALVHGLDHMESDTPDIVVVVDADCRFEHGSLEALAKEAFAANRPTQAEYLIHPPKEKTPGSVVSALAFLVRNRTRPRGLARLGMPVALTGTGMAFPWLQLRNAPSFGSYLVEDLLMGIEMAIAGHPPRLCSHVHVTSVLPETDDAAMGQRRRWEHGQLTTLTQQAPRLVLLGLAKVRPSLVAIGADLLVPPLAFLVIALGGAMAALGAAVFFGVSPVPFALVATGFTLVGFGVLVAWARHGREMIPGRYLLAIPKYVLWKIPIYLSFVLKRRQKTWERTERG